MNQFSAILTVFFLQASLTVVQAKEATMFAKQVADGKVEVSINYYAEDTCVKFQSVKEGHPEVIEPPKRSLVITVVIEKEDRKNCKQALTILSDKLLITDRPGIKSVEIFFVSKEGKFIRSSKPRIYRGLETHSNDDDEPEISSSIWGPSFVSLL